MYTHFHEPPLTDYDYLGDVHTYILVCTCGLIDSQLNRGVQRFAQERTGEEEQHLKQQQQRTIPHAISIVLFSHQQ